MSWNSCGDSLISIKDKRPSHFVYFESGDSFFDCFLVFYKHITATFHSNDSRRFAQETYRSWKVLLIFFQFFIKRKEIGRMN